MCVTTPRHNRACLLNDCLTPNVDCSWHQSQRIVLSWYSWLFSWRIWCLNGLGMAVTTNHGHRGRTSQYNTRLLLIRRRTYLAFIAQIVMGNSHIFLRRTYYGINVRLALFKHVHDDGMEDSIVLAIASIDFVSAEWLMRWPQSMTDRHQQWWLSELLCKLRWPAIFRQPSRVIDAWYSLCMFEIQTELPVVQLMHSYAYYTLNITHWLSSSFVRRSYYGSLVSCGA